VSEDLDLRLSAIERLLCERPPQTPSPALRSRVLAAVEKTVPATPYGKAAEGHPAKHPDVVAGTVLIGAVLMGMALSLLVVASLIPAVSPRAGLQRQLTPFGVPPLLSFAHRAEAAGLVLDDCPPSAPRRTGREPAAPANPHRRDILRSIDARSFLQGDI